MNSDVHTPSICMFPDKKNSLKFQLIVYDTVAFNALFKNFKEIFIEQ